MWRKGALDVVKEGQIARRSVLAFQLITGLDLEFMKENNSWNFPCQSPSLAP